MADAPEVQAPDVATATAGTPAQAPPDLGSPAMPVQAAPDASNLPVNTNAPAGQTPLPTPKAPPSGMFEKVLQVLAGSPQQNEHVDPQTGKIVSEGTITNKKTLAMHIVAAAILGMARGAGAGPGPNHLGKAFAAGAEGAVQDRESQKKEEVEAYERDQKAQVQKYQVAHLNAETSMNQANAKRLGLETMEKNKEMNGDAVQQLADQGAIETDESGEPIALTKAEILDKIKKGELNASDSIGMQWGGETGADGEPEARFVINKNPNAQIKVTQEQVDAWAEKGVNVPKELVGQTIAAKSYQAYTNQAQTMDTADATLKVLREDAGDNKELAAKIPTKVDYNTPGLRTALLQYQRALLGAGNDPMKALEAVQSHSKQSGDLLVKTFGGLGTMQQLAQQRLTNTKLDEQRQLEDEKATREKYPQDAITASIGGQPMKGINGSWKWNGQNFPDEQSAAKAFGTAYEKQKIAENVAQHNEEHPQSASWVAGATADEKKKAELAENITENATQVNNTLKNHPEIVGAIAGRFTNVKQMIGNDNPFISGLGVRIHNIAMANSGVHGFRSQQGVEETENLLLNKFKNGPDAVKGALDANVDSVQTFIDDARPETYHTHSKQGGAKGYYGGRTNGANAENQGNAFKLHAKITDFAHSGIDPQDKEAGTLYTDDNKHYFKANGEPYTPKGQ